MIFKRIKQRRRAEGNHDADRDTREAAVLAAAVLLQLMARADYQDQAAEQSAARRALERSFGLTPQAAEGILDQARGRAAGATDVFSFTRELNRHLSREERIRLVEALWEVAFADGILERHERHLMRRLADLLYVSHKDYIAAKLRARRSAPGD